MHEDIKSNWVFRKGKWNNKKNKYENISHTRLLKTIAMEIINRDNKNILQFHGGPTGYESYYIDDLLRNNNINQKELCICAGTINCWAECYVSWQDVLKFIKGVLNAKKNNNSN